MAPVSEELENSHDAIDDRKDEEPVAGKVADAAAEEEEEAERTEEEGVNDDDNECGCVRESERPSGVGSGDSTLRYIANMT